MRQWLKLGSPALSFWQKTFGAAYFANTHCDFVWRLLFNKSTAIPDIFGDME